MPTNALIHEKSPYLRQHAHNPVDWLPWGEAAFEKARQQDKPIFLSIGYSTCHWCHVMAHESFEKEHVAEVLNREFVPVKVDREERPDVDRIYMLFVQASTGSGGWPMSVWLTPNLKPFFGGTYFPPDSRYGRPGFREVLEHLARAWKNERAQVEQSGESVAGQLAKLNEPASKTGEPDPKLLESAFWQFRRQFDPTWGGFGAAPKFPRPVVLNFLLRFYGKTGNEEALEMVHKTLLEMAKGGMHDQLGGGFHRYSVDERWFVPHFEKMLYDQAQLAVAYLEAYQATGDERLANVAHGVLSYVLRDLRDSQGGFYSAEDADSPDPDNPAHSGEGAFYIWRQQELTRLLEPKALELFERRFGVLPDGNVENDPQGEFHGRNILYQAASPNDAERLIEQASARVFEARNGRPRPHLDNKILTSWNALMISALARGFAVLGGERYRDAAVQAVEFLSAAAYEEEAGTLRRSYCEGPGGVEGFLDDYAFLAQALLDLFEVTFDPGYLARAKSLAANAVELFADKDSGGFFSTRAGASDLLLRMKDEYDGAEPTGNSVFTDVLVRLAHLTGDREWEELALSSLRALAAKLAAQPTMAPQMLVALERWLGGPKHVVIRSAQTSPEAENLLREEWKKFEPNTVTLLVTDDSARLLDELDSFFQSLENRGRLTIYRCLNFACDLPQVLKSL